MTDDRPEINQRAIVTARLHDSAEEMLTALKDVLDYWESTGFAECEPCCDCVVDIVRAAIAKAEGS